MFRLQLSSIFATLLFLAPAFGQWQEIGNEQIPDNLRVEGVQAIDADGLRLSDDGDTLGIFLKDGGNIGIGTSNPNHQLDLRTLTGLDTTAGSQNDLLALWGHGNRSDRVVFFTERFSTAGSTSDWTTVHHRWQRIVDSVEMGFIGFGRASGNTYAIQLGYGDDIFLALTDSGNLAIEGELDASGGGEFGDSTHTRSYYQSACAIQANTQATYNHLTDTLNPATTGSEVFVSAQCPWVVPGTRIKSVRFVVYANTSDDYVNFAVKRQSASAPGTTTDIVAFGGADYTQSSGLTQISGDFYQRTETCNHTIGDGEKVWAIALLYADSTADDCRLVGIEWTFEQRRY